MGELIEHHNAVIRCVIVRHKAYEVKTIGDSFMIAGGWPLTGKETSSGAALTFQPGLLVEPYPWKYLPTCLKAPPPSVLTQLFLKVIFSGGRL